MNSRTESTFYVYLLVIELVAMVIFIYGFFPVNPSLPGMSSFEDVPLGPTETLRYTKVVNKTVLMIVDAMRLDFVVQGSLPYLGQLLKEDKGVLLRTRVEAPTVTMPRIKSLVSGTIPNFIDVVVNFGSSLLNEDNLLRQAHENGLKLVFYGDNTWLSLFPEDYFLRSEGTTSFFITDYVEVDLNVTRNLREELKRQDWDLMILHYLGLDHIGHLEGPKSPKMTGKLKEMDGVVESIYSALPKDDAYVFIVCSDHGMKDTGGHGGSSDSEIYVPTIIISNVVNTRTTLSSIQQIDVTPLLSTLLGLPIPANSIGVLHPALLSGLPMTSLLFQMYYVTRHISNIYCNSYPSCRLSSSYQRYLQALSIYDKYRTELSDIKTSTILKLFTEAQVEMSSSIQKNLTHFDVYSILISIVLFSTVVVLSFMSVTSLKVPFMTFVSAFNLNLLIHFGCRLLSQQSIFFRLHPTSVVLVFVINIALSVNIVLIYNNFRGVDFFRRHTKIDWVENQFTVFTLMYVVSLFTTSLIEEEHQFWYFTFVTLCLSLYYDSGLKLVIILSIHRFLRSLNSTGNKWSFVYDSGDFLSEPTNIWYLTLFYIGSVTLIPIRCHLTDKYYGKNHFRRSRLVNNSLYVGMATCCAIYRGSTEQIIALLPSISSPVSVFYLLLLLYVLLNVVLKTHCLNILINVLLLLSGLLYRPHNAPLMTILVFVSDNLTWALNNRKRDFVNVIYLHYWLGQLFFYYAGNSNSLSTIDITPGFIGVQQYNLAYAVVLTTMHAFLSQLLSFTCLVHHLTTYNKLRSTSVVLQWFTRFFSVNCLVYCSLVAFQRHHLFVWSVFSPKLLYLGVNLLLHSLCCFALYAWTRYFVQI